MRASFVVAFLVAAGTTIYVQQAPPVDWIDPATGHRVVRLTDDAGGSTLYFHDNAFSAAGDTMMFNTPNGIAVVDVAKIGAGAKPQMVTSAARGGYFARRAREIYFNGAGGRGGGPVMAVNVDTRQVRAVPHARGLVNADESLSVVKNANAVDPDGTHPRPPTRVAVPQLQRMFPGKKMEDLTPDQQYSVTKEDGLAPRALNPGLQSFVLTNLKTGESRETGFQYGDLNHQQFNPVDPNLLVYCHEGTWHELNRTWTIRTDGTQMRLMHTRAMDMEINGHEWWSWDGKTVWFDLQTPRSQVFWIAGVNMATGKEVRYHVDRDWWGVHFNSSRDDTLFASDGGDASQVAYSTDGMWINLFRVRPAGTLVREKLVDMSRHNYVTGRGGVEPNVHITPDKRWVVFTGQFAPGQRHVYAVEIARAAPGQGALPAGDTARGRALFDGKGECVGCHRVRDKGSRFGPDLTDIGSRAGNILSRGTGASPFAPIPPDVGPVARAQAELERALVDPGADILPQNRTVRLVTRGGETITARVLNQDTFSIQVIDTKEQVRSIQKSDLREFAFIKTSPMPSFRDTFSPQEMADVIAYLISLKGINK